MQEDRHEWLTSFADMIGCSNLAAVNALVCSRLEMFLIGNLCLV